MQSQTAGRRALYADLLKALALSVVTAGMCGTVFSNIDVFVLGALIPFFDIDPRSLIVSYDLSTSTLMTILIQWPLLFASYRAARKTGGGSTAFTALQILVVAVFTQSLVWRFLKLATMPVAVLSGLIIAFTTGKNDKKRAEKAETQTTDRIILNVKQQELKEAHLQLVKQDEADRRILASDLHDQVLNDLKSLRTAVSALKTIKSDDERTNKLLEIETMVDQSTSQVRDVMENLTPSVLENLGLASAIDDLLRRSAVRGKFKTRFKNDGQTGLDKLSNIQSLLIFRTVQEALTNVVKHAEAKKVEIEITAAGDPLALTVIIADDGKGFATDKQRDQSRGLRYMRQRMDLIGGHIAWLPGKDNRGCRVEVRVEPGDIS